MKTIQSQFKQISNNKSCKFFEFILPYFVLMVKIQGERERGDSPAVELGVTMLEHNKLRKY